jgi:hypothetical protein
MNDRRGATSSRVDRSCPARAARGGRRLAVAVDGRARNAGAERVLTLNESATGMSRSAKNLPE